MEAIKAPKSETAESRIARIIPLTEVVRRVGKHASTLRRWWQRDPPLFPRPRRTGPNSIGFVDIQIDDWILTRPEVGNDSRSLINTAARAATNVVEAAQQEVRAVRAVGRPSCKHAWQLVDDLVYGGTFKGPSDCAKIVLKHLGRCQGREKILGREFTIPTEGTVRNYLRAKAKKLGIAWQSKHLKSSPK